jgi:hypothetical protein
MRAAFAHQATLTMDQGQDTAALGAAVTAALCGHWEHRPPCPLAPHHTAARRTGDEVTVRILFAADPADVTEVRRRIDLALAAGLLDGPHGPTAWRLRDTSPAPVTADETDHAGRLIRT